VLLSRLWHSLVSDLSERAAAVAFRAQSVAEAVVPGKSMAVFASVAALAGGGFAMDGASHTPAPPPAALSAPSASPAATRPASAPRRAPKRLPRARVHPKPAVAARPRVRRATVAAPVGPQTMVVAPPQAPAAVPARASAGPRSVASRARPAASEFAVETR
jgi:hypothetical protein